MGENIRIQGKGGGLSVFSKFPWTLLIIGYLVVVHNMGLDMRGMVGYVFIGLGVLVLFIEFFKSGDINAVAFLVDIVGAVMSVIVATVLMCWLYFQAGGWHNITFFHWFGCAIILGDAIISPFNAFRTALRNLGLGVGG